METTGYITETQVTNPLGLEAIEYNWIGGKVALVSRRYLTTTAKHNRSTFWIGPYRLRVIEDSPCLADVFVMRDGWHARGVQAAYRVTRYAQRFYAKCIFTLAVWGLADFHPGWPPSWRDVHCLMGLSHKLRR